VKAERERKKWKRRSSGTKRTLTQSIGSDTDDEDLQPVMLEGVNEVGSSARRLRRKVGERTSLILMIRRRELRRLMRDPRVVRR